MANCESECKKRDERKKDRHKNKNRWFLRSLITICKRTEKNENYVRVIAGACIASNTDLMLTQAYPHIKKLVDAALHVENAAQDFSDAKNKAIQLVAEVGTVATIPNPYLKAVAILKAVYDLQSILKLMIHGFEDIARQRDILVAFLRFYAELVEACKKIRAELDIPAPDIPSYDFKNSDKSTWEDIVDGLKLLYEIYTDDGHLPPHNPQLPPP